MDIPFFETTFLSFHRKYIFNDILLDNSKATILWKYNFIFMKKLHENHGKRSFPNEKPKTPIR